MSWSCLCWIVCWICWCCFVLFCHVFKYINEHLRELNRSRLSTGIHSLTLISLFSNQGTGSAPYIQVGAWLMQVRPGWIRLDSPRRASRGIRLNSGHNYSDSGYFIFNSGRIRLDSGLFRPHSGQLWQDIIGHKQSRFPTHHESSEAWINRPSVFRPETSRQSTRTKPFLCGSFASFFSPLAQCWTMYHSRKWLSMMPLMVVCRGWLKIDGCTRAYKRGFIVIPRSSSSRVWPTNRLIDISNERAEWCKGVER